MVKIYTKKGDDGSTGLIDGSRVKKNDPRVDAYGDIDELNAPTIDGGRNMMRTVN